MEIKIIIGIPTYNRHETILRRLNEIESFGNLISGVVICDNSDTEDIKVSTYCETHKNWHYFKNSSNIGGGANFLRVIENAGEGTHLWWRGDDDPITKEQVNALINAPLLLNELLILKPGKTPYFTDNGLESFSYHFNEIQSMGWLSMVVLPIDLAKRSLKYGYWGIHTGWANVALILGLFKVHPDLVFHTVPFEMKEGDFREVGQAAGQSWAFFNTCIKNFVLTANLIDNKKIKNLYLRKWRDTQNFRYLGTMIRIRVGMGNQESFTFRTFSPLLSLQNPNKFFLFFYTLFFFKITTVLIKVNFNFLG